MTPNPRKTADSRSVRMLPRDSLLFLAVLLLIALAGFNSGNNLLYLIVGVMLGMVLVSIVAGRINLSRISVTRQLPTYAFARSPFTVIFEIVNNKKLWKSFGIILEDGIDRSKFLFVLSIENRGNMAHTTELAIARRGLYKFSPVTLRSGFPFGLFNVRRRLTVAEEIVIYPQIHDILKVSGGSSVIREEFPQPLKGPGSGLYSTREYRHGEEATHIYWKLSAKLDRLMVRETEREERRMVCIVLDNSLDNDSKESQETLERAVSDAASLVWYLCKNDYSVKLVTRNTIISYGTGSEQMHKVMIALALIEATYERRGTFPPTTSIFEGGTGVLITCDDGKEPRSFLGSDFALVMDGKISIQQ